MATRARTARGEARPRVIDLDSARTARAEITGEPVVLKFAGKEIELPPELPYAAARVSHDESAFIKALLDEDDAEELLSWSSVDDMKEFAELVLKVYGVDEGE